jgi:signal transduction histidine kinase
MRHQAREVALAHPPGRDVFGGSLDADRVPQAYGSEREAGMFLALDACQRDGGTTDHARAAAHEPRSAQRRAASLVDVADVVALVGHELRAPLSTISLAAEMLDTADSADAVSLRHALRRQVEHLRLLFDAALRSVEIVGGAGMDGEATTDLPAVLTALCEGLPVDRAQVAVSIDVDEDFPQLAIEPAAFTVVMNNLLMNAIKHSGCERIRIVARRSGACGLISVTDSGRGLPASLRANLSGRQSLTSRRQRGLGLYVTQALTQSFGGDVVVEDRPAGTCVIVTLPLRIAR